MGEFFESLWRRLTQSIKDGELEETLKTELANQSVAVDKTNTADYSHQKEPQLSAVDQYNSSCSSDSDPEMTAKRRIRGLLSYDTYGLDLSQPREGKKRRKDERSKNRLPVGVIFERDRSEHGDIKFEFDTQAIVTSVFDLNVKGENLEKRKLGRKIPKIRALDQPLGWRFL